VGDDEISNEFTKAILRILCQTPCEDIEINATCQGTPLEATVHHGELFSCRYREGIPKDHTRYKDYTVPLTLLKKGWNSFQFASQGYEPTRIVRMELALYHA
jgi:hypothetical protein